MNLLTACNLANAAYLIDAVGAQAAVERLGATYAGLFASPECQLLFCHMDDELLCLIGGTHFLENTKYLEVLDNLRGDALDIGDGKLVHEGYAAPFEALFNQLPADLKDYTGRLRAIGHSMGGSRSGYARRHWPQAQVTQIAPPKSANPAFWEHYHPRGEGLEWLVNEDDFAPGWPWVGPWAHAKAPMYWMRGGYMVAIAHARPGLNESEPAHNLDHYAAHVEAIYAQPQHLPTALRAGMMIAVTS